MLYTKRQVRFLSSLMYSLIHSIPFLLTQVQVFARTRLDGAQFLEFRDHAVDVVDLATALSHGGFLDLYRLEPV